MVVLGLPLLGCDDDGAPDYQPTYTIKSAAAEQSYRVSCPFSTPETLFSIYQPLIDYVNGRLGGPKLKLEAARDYESFEQKLYYRNLDFALANPYQTVMAVPNGYRIFAKMTDDSQLRGLVLVRRDSPVREVADLKGKAVSYPADSALASTLLPQAFFHQHGLNVKTDVDNRYVGSEESSILNVFLGNVAAGTTWPLAWTRFQRDEPAKAAQLTVRWETQSLPNNGWVARDDVPPEVVDKVRGILAGMGGDPEGRRILEAMLVAGFEPADDQTFEPVQDFLRQFNQTVREVALP
ncbi:MAG TPA: phosphate/phosphite/phosphonate ABC transporter substrate-binding protein [Magnetospirillum sp.]|nr:phosphate/phosphite/phosphonate ABC transporter substrate-binding protein [Magnetospirillum sp.]